SAILNDVKLNGDAAVRKYSHQFDGFGSKDLLVSSSETDDALKAIKSELKEAITFAKNNIEKFHAAQINQDIKIETTAGVSCGRKAMPIEKVGLYIPGGTAPLFSTLLMLGIPAILAGCKDIIICTP